MIVDSALYRKGQRIEVDCFPHEFDKMRAEATEDGDFVWVGLYKPSEGELGDVADSFGLREQHFAGFQIVEPEVPFQWQVPLPRVPKMKDDHFVLMV